MADQTGDEPAGNAAPPLPADPLVAGRLAGRLADGQLALLRRYGEVCPTAAGQVRELATAGPGEFVAELTILTGERVFTTAVVKESGSVLVVPVDRLQEV